MAATETPEEIENVGGMSMRGKNKIVMTEIVNLIFINLSEG